MCVTDLVACCETQGHGNWYYPDGSRVTGGGGGRFRTNRGQNEDYNGQQFYGSVRLWRFYTPLERGLFHLMLVMLSRLSMSIFVSHQ